MHLEKYLWFFSKKKMLIYKFFSPPQTPDHIFCKFEISIVKPQSNLVLILNSPHISLKTIYVPNCSFIMTKFFYKLFKTSFLQLVLNGTYDYVFIILN